MIVMVSKVIETKDQLKSVKNRFTNSRLIGKWKQYKYGQYTRVDIIFDENLFHVKEHFPDAKLVDPDELKEQKKKK